MQDDEQLLRKRFAELSARAYVSGHCTYSEFLTLSQQQTLFSMQLDSPFELCGGFDCAERRIAVFGGTQPCGGDSLPIACVSIKPASQKFADDISHRDCLGSLMALGMRREVLGDIVIIKNEAYLFCLESVADYITAQLDKVRHTTVRCERCDAPAEITAPIPEEREYVVASTRLDAVTAAVFSLSRGDSQKLFEQKKVFINSKLCTSASHTIAGGDIVSVRGFGRFRYEGVKLETRKGKLRIIAGIF